MEGIYQSLDHYGGAWELTVASEKNREIPIDHVSPQSIATETSPTYT